MRTQVAIIGAGPAGLTLALLLARAGVEAVVLEARSREYVEHRVRAGLLEHGTVELLHELGVGERLAREGLEHHGIYLRHLGHTFHLPITELTGRRITIYGQQEVVKDLIAAWLGRGGELRFEAEAVAVAGLDTSEPRVTYRYEGAEHELRCELISGCDGFHGRCRETVPAGLLTEYQFSYPFGWLGILVRAAPATDELIYAWHEHGFALYSMRSPEVSRLYLQVAADDQIERWPEARIWEELQQRLSTEGWRVEQGEIFEMGITPMRSYVCEPMRVGRLCLAGDAAHIVPPTGAKGLNLAVNDVRLLAPAVTEYLRSGSEAALDGYSEAALRRVWRAQDFSNYMTQLLHRLSDDEFGARLQIARLQYVERSKAAARSLAENYAGLPATAEF